MIQVVPVLHGVIQVVPILHDVIQVIPILPEVIQEKMVLLPVETLLITVINSTVATNIFSKTPMRIQ